MKSVNKHMINSVDKPSKLIDEIFTGNIVYQLVNSLVR